MLFDLFYSGFAWPGPCCSPPLPAPPPPAFLVLGQRPGSSPVESHHTAVYRRAPARRARTAPRACSTRPGSKNHTERENRTVHAADRTHHTTPHRTAPHRTPDRRTPHHHAYDDTRPPARPHHTAPHRTAPHCTARALHEHARARTTQPPHAHIRRRAGGWVGVPRASRGCSTRPHAT